MNVSKYLFVVIIAVCAIHSNAQTAALEGSISISNYTTSAESEVFFFDTEEEICFVDFANFNLNINSILIVDSKGNEIFSEEVWDLPVNTIYELSTKDLKSGTYHLILNTYKGNMSKDIEIR